MTVAPASPRRVTIDVAARSEFGPQLGTVRTHERTRAGDNDVTIPATALKPPAGWPGGKNIFDVIVRDAGAGHDP